MGKLNAIELKRARLVPSSAFASPDEVLDSLELSRAQKLAILRRWEFELPADDAACGAEAGRADRGSGAPSLALSWHEANRSGTREHDPPLVSEPRSDCLLSSGYRNRIRRARGCPAVSRALPVGSRMVITVHVAIAWTGAAPGCRPAQSASNGAEGSGGAAGTCTQSRQRRAGGITRISAGRDREQGRATPPGYRLMAPNSGRGPFPGTFVRRPRQRGCSPHR